MSCTCQDRKDIPATTCSGCLSAPLNRNDDREFNYTNVPSPFQSSVLLSAVLQILITDYLLASCNARVTHDSHNYARPRVFPSRTT